MKSTCMAAIHADSGLDNYCVIVIDYVRCCLKYKFQKGCPLTLPTMGVHVDSRPHYTLVCAQADYRAEQLTCTSSERERIFLTNAARLAKHRRSAAAAAHYRSIRAPGQSWEELYEANRQSCERDKAALRVMCAETDKLAAIYKATGCDQCYYFKA